MGFTIDTFSLSTGEIIKMIIDIVLFAVVFALFFVWLSAVRVDFGSGWVEGVNIGLCTLVAVLFVVMLICHPDDPVYNGADGFQMICDWESITCTTTENIFKSTGIPVHLDSSGTKSESGTFTMEWLDDDGRAHQGGTLIYQGPHTVHLYDDHGRRLGRQDRKFTDRMIADSKEGVIIGNGEIGLNQDPIYRIGRDRFVSHDYIDKNEAPAPKAAIEAITVRDRGDDLSHVWAMGFSGHMYLVPRK